MVRLAEITINQQDRIFDKLINEISETVYSEYNAVSNKTEKFRYNSYEIYDQEVINDHVEEYNRLLNIVKLYYTDSHQTYKMVVYLIDYFVR